MQTFCNTRSDFHKEKTAYGPLTPYKVSEKTNKPKKTARKKDRQMDKVEQQTLIHRTLPAMARGPIK